MRLGVLDVGSNTFHLLVVDAHDGAAPLPAHSHKVELRLAELIVATSGSPTQASTLVSSSPPRRRSPRTSVSPRHGFATSAIREATNGEDVLAEVHERTGVDLRCSPAPTRLG